MSDRLQLLEYKGNRCTGCGEGVQEVLAKYGTIKRLFHFHHIDPTHKAHDYSLLMKRRLSRSQLLELDKCVLLCVKCHSLAHALEIRAALTLSVQIDNRTVKQRIHGWAITDQITRTFTFLSNEPFMLDVCEVRIGKEPLRTLLTREILESSNLHAWLQRMSQYKNIEVYSHYLRRVALKIVHIDGKVLSVEQNIGFPIMQGEFKEEKPGNEEFFLQNGLLLTKAGTVQTSGTVKFQLTLA
jgi:hypothetical protein